MVEAVFVEFYKQVVNKWGLLNSIKIIECYFVNSSGINIVFLVVFL